MTVREYLNQIADLDECIKQDMRFRLDKIIMATGGKGIDYSYDKIQNTPSGDVLCNQVCEIVELENKISDEIKEFDAARDTIIRQIRGLHDIRFNQVLFGIYVEQKSSRQLAIELLKSERTIQAWHSEALNAFEQAYKDEMRYFY